MQLEMSFGKRPNGFRKALSNGEFVFLTECQVPSDENDVKRAGERLMPLAEKMWSFDDLHGGIALLDSPGTPWSAVEVASVLPENERNRNLFYVSGAGRDREALQKELTLAAGVGVENIAAVTGDAPASLVACRHQEFTESIESVGMLEKSECFFPGAVFNPFQYRVESVHAAYGVLEKKLNAGSRYIITQAGWDMLQLQALSWYMLKSKLCYPLIARLMLLTPDRVEKIRQGQFPGIRLSKDFNKLLDREMRGSRAQFEAAQYRRLEIQVAGCRLLGFSGVQICGASYPGQAKVVAERIRSAMNEFKSFEQWLDEYNSHQGGVEIGSALHGYRLYDRVLRRDYPADVQLQASDPGKPAVSAGEKLRYKLKKFLFSQADKHKASRDRLLKKLLVSCRSCDKCRLPENEYVCVETCPKHMSNGPCGNVRIDGKCEIGDFECRFLKMSRYAYWRKSEPIK